MNSTKGVLAELKLLAEKWWIAWVHEEDATKKGLALARAESFAHAACLILGLKIKTGRRCESAGSMMERAASVRGRKGRKS